MAHSFKPDDRVQEVGEKTKRRSGIVFASCGLLVRWDNGDKPVGLRRAISDCEKVGGKLVLIHKAGFTTTDGEFYHCNTCSGIVLADYVAQHAQWHLWDEQAAHNQPATKQGEETMFDTIKDAIQNKLIYVVVLLKNGQRKESHSFGSQEEATAKYNELDRQYPPNKDGGVSPMMLMMARVSQS